MRTLAALTLTVAMMLGVTALAVQDVPGPRPEIGPEWVVILTVRTEQADQLRRMEFRLIVNAPSEGAAVLRAFRGAQGYLANGLADRIEFVEAARR